MQNQVKSTVQCTVQSSIAPSHLAGEYEAEEDSDGELAVTEEDDVEQVRVGGVLQEKPAQ